MVYFAELAVCLLSAFACLFFGAFDVVLISGAGLCLIALFLPRIRATAFLCFAIAILLGWSASLDPLWRLILVPVMFGIIRFLAVEKPRGSYVAVFVLLTAVLSAVTQSNEVSLLFLIAAVCAIPLPIKRIAAPLLSETKSAALVAVIVFCTALAAVFGALSRGKGRTVMLKAGGWATAEVKFSGLEQINIRGMYSYSELLDLLKGENALVEELNENVSEAWLITPTRPFSESQVSHVTKWVENGGHLIVVTDHTDLFGHARNLNVLLDQFSIQTSTTAFFPERSAEKATKANGVPVRLKTSNTQSGLLCWPLISARWWEELADYSSPNFFGALQPSKGDDQHQRVIALRKSARSGQVTVMGDSTIFANFAIYQPGVPPLIQTLRQRSAWPTALLPALLLCLFAPLISRSPLPLCIVGILGFLPLVCTKAENLNWSNFVFWAGDERCVYEFGDPSIRISTAYSVAALSGQKPRWTDDWKSVPGGFWVSAKPPPNVNWRWVEIADSKKDFVDDNPSLDPLLSAVTKSTPRQIEWNAQERNRIAVKQVWTDDSFGDWWFDRGLGIGRTERIRSWTSWVAGEESFAPKEFSPIIIKRDPKHYWVILDGAEEKELAIPEIPFTEGLEAHLGRGVWIKMLKTDGKNVMIGGRGYTEGLGGPSNWLLVPKE